MTECGRPYSAMEILAPSGSPEQLMAAVRSGADAVYLGADTMNARRSAANFSREELDGAARYCHEYGVKLYVVMNTLLFDDEFGQAVELLKAVCAMPADGIIVQDIGLASLIRRLAPDMPLHASTQMTVHNPAALNILRRLGFKRVVLAREMSLEEIREMANPDIELEAFIHGALCMSVSGQCYLSSMLGGRSGNRGRCAQPCRLPFKSGKLDYCLSLKDMSHIDYIRQLGEAGVCSVKIEGRMKRPEYCAAAVTLCRSARDGGYPDDGLAAKLQSVFSRSGFTDGYITGKRGEEMFGYRTRDDVAAADSALLSSLHGLYKNEYQRVPVELSFKAAAGEAVKLAARDAAGLSAGVLGEIPQTATGHALSCAQVKERLSKTGGTPYIVGNVYCDIEDGLYLPASSINNLRRECLGRLSRKRSRPARVSCAGLADYTIAAHKPLCSSGVGILHAVFSGLSQIPETLDKNLGRVYMPLESVVHEEFAPLCVRLKKMGIEAAVEAPRGLFSGQDRLEALLKKAGETGIRVCMIHNIGFIGPVRDAGLSPYGGFGLNITNTRSIDAFEGLGLSGCELSFEMTLKRVALLGGKIERGIIVYGRLPMMLTRNCPAAKGNCKGKKDGSCAVIDRKNVSFPVQCRMGCSEVFNSVPLYMLDRIKTDLSELPVERHIMRFTTETSEECRALLRGYGGQSRAADLAGEYTRGLYYRAVE